MVVAAADRATIAPARIGAGAPHQDGENDRMIWCRVQALACFFRKRLTG
jgi:hypothetical protein